MSTILVVSICTLVISGIGLLFWLTPKLRRGAVAEAAAKVLANSEKRRREFEEDLRAQKEKQRKRVDSIRTPADIHQLRNSVLGADAEDSGPTTKP